MNTDALHQATGAGTANGNAQLPGAGSEGMLGCCGVPLSWQEIRSLASSCKYGIVLEERQLLDAIAGTLTSLQAMARGALASSGGQEWPGDLFHNSLQQKAEALGHGSMESNAINMGIDQGAVKP
jgi:hypothetical protein